MEPDTSFHCPQEPATSLCAFLAEYGNLHLLPAVSVTRKYAFEVRNFVCSLGVDNMIGGGCRCHGKKM
jgi:hypothetical protein